MSKRSAPGLPHLTVAAAICTLPQAAPRTKLDHYSSYFILSSGQPAVPATLIDDAIKDLEPGAKPVSPEVYCKLCRESIRATMELSKAGSPIVKATTMQSHIISHHPWHMCREDAGETKNLPMMEGLVESFNSSRDSKTAGCGGGVLAIRSKRQMGEVWADLLTSNPCAFRIGICEDPGMRAAMERFTAGNIRASSDLHVTRNVVTAALAEKHAKLITAKAAQLSGWLKPITPHLRRRLSGSFDCWDDATSIAYLCLHLHGFDYTAGRTSNMMASMPAFDSPHTGERLAAMLHSIIRELGEERGSASLGSITADGAANTQKGGRLAISQALRGLGDAAIARLRAVPQPHLDDAVALLVFVQYCFHHNAQLVIKKAADPAGRLELDIIAPFRKLYAPMYRSHVVKEALHRACSAAGIKYLQPILMCLTRYNTVYFFLKRAEHLLPAFRLIPAAVLHMSEAEKAAIFRDLDFYQPARAAIMKALQVVVEATDELSSCDIPTMGLLPIWLKRIEDAIFINLDAVLPAGGIPATLNREVVADVFKIMQDEYKARPQFGKLDRARQPIRWLVAENLDLRTGEDIYDRHYAHLSGTKPGYTEDHLVGLLVQEEQRILRAMAEVWMVEDPPHMITAVTAAAALPAAAAESVQARLQRQREAAAAAADTGLAAPAAAGAGDPDALAAQALKQWEAAKQTRLAILRTEWAAVRGCLAHVRAALDALALPFVDASAVLFHARTLGPHVVHFGIEVNSQPATEAPAERTFSIGGSIKSKTRARLTAQRTSHLVALKQAWDADNMRARLRKGQGDRASRRRQLIDKATAHAVALTQDYVARHSSSSAADAGTSDTEREAAIATAHEELLGYMRKCAVADLTEHAEMEESIAASMERSLNGIHALVRAADMRVARGAAGAGLAAVPAAEAAVGAGAGAAGAGAGGGQPIELDVDGPELADAGISHPRVAPELTTGLDELLTVLMRDAAANVVCGDDGDVWVPVKTDDNTSTDLWEERLRQALSEIGDDGATGSAA
jgi:hypothetical protein